MNRRTFLGVFGTGLLLPAVSSAETPSPAIPAGSHVFASFDAAMEKFMAERNVPGGSLAVVKDRQLVYTRGYGWADRDKKSPVIPTSLFRVASISKPFTAVAVLKLVEQGKLKLDDKAFDLINHPPILLNGDKPDPRLKQITIRHLLQHTGGWDRDKSYDAMFRTKIIASAAGVEAPPNTKTIIRYMLGQPLDFDPGTQYTYSNFGYCVLGRIIEKVTGKSYEDFVKESVLAPIGIKRMHLGASLQSGPEEVSYYRQKNGKSDSVFPAIEGKVPSPYGGFYLESMDSHGGWLASAVDLARFAAALDDPQDCPILKTDTLREMYAPPAPPVSRDKDGKLAATFYGCGWLVRPIIGREGKANYWHNGSLPGTYSLLVRRNDGLSWAVLFNQRSEDRKDGEMDSALHVAAGAVTEWPSENLFSQFA